LASTWTCIALVGLMGSGKSTVGRSLASELRLPFFDIDQLVEQSTGESIATIFRDHGEPAFRRVERDIALELLGRAERKVVAFGGGTILDSSVDARCMHDDIWVHYLHATPATCAARLSRDVASRPLLVGNDLQTTLAALYRDRDPCYRRHGAFVETDGRSVDEITTALAHKIAPRAT